MCVDPIDGIKGKTWGPSTMQKDRFRPSTSILGSDRCCKSAPNIQKTFSHLGGHSNIGALQELGKCSLEICWYVYICYKCTKLQFIHRFKATYITNSKKSYKGYITHHHTA